MSVSVQIICDNCGGFIHSDVVGIVNTIGQTRVVHKSFVISESRDGTHYCGPACMVKAYSNQVCAEWGKEKGTADV